MEVLWETNVLFIGAQDLDFFGGGTPPSERQTTATAAPQTKVLDFFSKTLEDMGLAGKSSPKVQRKDSSSRIDITALFKRTGSSSNLKENSSAPSSPSQQRKKKEEEQVEKIDPVEALLSKFPDLSFMVANSIVK